MRLCKYCRFFISYRDNIVSTRNTNARMRRLGDKSTQMTRTRLACLFTRIVVCLFAIIVFALSIVILARTLASASIAVSQFGDDLSLTGIYTAVIVIGSFQLFAIIGFYIVAGLFLESFVSSLVLALVHLLLTLPSEAIIYKFVSCFNYTNNDLVVARSCMLILLMLASLVALLVNSFFQRENNSTSSNFSELFKSGLPLAISLLVGITLVSLNIATMAKLRPQLGLDIQPSSLLMGYLNQTEISHLETKGTSGVSLDLSGDRLLGNLGDIVFSSNKRLYSRQCSGSGKSRSCTNYYVHYYVSEVECATRQPQSVFYADCQVGGASTLTVFLRYIDSGDYPTYRCVVNAGNQTCVSECGRLLASGYELTLFQPQVATSLYEAAWTRFSNCDTTRPQIRLTHDSTLNPCPSAANSPIHVYAGVQFILAIFVFVLI